MYNNIKTYLEKNLSSVRFEHSLSTSKSCVFLCNLIGVDSEPGRIAGLAHDIAREMHAEKILDLVSLDGYGISDYEKSHPILLHGRAGAFILKDEFGVTNNEILDAVRWHTTGHPDMSTLGKILFVSDFIEPGRRHITEEDREGILNMPLDKMVLKVLSRQISYLRDKGNTIVENSILLYDVLISGEGKKR